MNGSHDMQAPVGNGLQLTLATGAFCVCFAIFGSVSALMPILKRQMDLSAVQVSIAIAVPVLLGSIGRIPLGILADRFGGRIVFSVAMAWSVAAAVMIGWAESYPQLLVCGLLLGVSLATFSIGVGFVSSWYPPQQQGMALGIYGAGNIGQSLAAYGAPVIAASLGVRWGFWAFALLAAAWLIFFVMLARNAPRPGNAKKLMDFIRPLSQPRSWLLSLYYFLTFGGFVAMAIYLPIFLTEIFALTPEDAGFRTAGFVVLATVMRPVGGWLADRVGGDSILLFVFPATAILGLFMTFPSMVPFTMGALGMALAIGLGNGAVFKLVPQYFPTTVGSVTGLVGAAGGLGGFFPPLVVGSIREATGSFVWGFVLLAVFAAGCFVASLLAYRRPPIVSDEGWSMATQQ